MEPSGPKESPAQSHGVCSALRDSGVSDRGLRGGGGGGGAGERKFPLRGPTPRHPQPARGQVKRDRALLQVAGQRRGWGKARQQWHFYLGLLGSERVGGGGGGRRPGRGGGERPQHLATHLLLLNPVRAERWVGRGGLARSRGWGTPPLGPWPGLAISRSGSKRGFPIKTELPMRSDVPLAPSGTHQAGEQIGVALVGGRRRLPARLRSFREAGFPEALRRPGSSQMTRAGRAARFQARRALQVSRAPRTLAPD